MKFNISEIEACILDRRSIGPKDYTNRKVHKEIIERLLNVARFAPSHGLTQPWYFKVYTEKGVDTIMQTQADLYKQLTDEKEFKEEKYNKILARKDQCSVVIAICMKRGDNPKIPIIEEVEAVACSVQNMHLLATAYGIGGFWSSPKFVYSLEMNEALGLREQDKCLGFFYLGYPAIDWPKTHRKPLEYHTEWINE